MREKWNLKQLVRKTKECYSLLGWKGGDGGFDAWTDEEHYFIAIESKKKKLRKQTLDKIRKIFGAVSVEFYDEGYTGKPYIVVDFGVLR